MKNSQAQSGAPPPKQLPNQNIKFNLGSNNSFILKNSSIVITQNPHKQEPVPQLGRASSHGGKKASLTQKGPTQLALDSKPKLPGQGTKPAGFPPAASNGFNSTKGVPNKLFAQGSHGVQGDQATNNYKIVQSFTGGVIGNAQQRNSNIGKSPHGNTMSALLGPKTTKARGKSEQHGSLLNQPSTEGDPLNLIAVQSQSRRAQSKVEKYEQAQANNAPPSKGSSRQQALRGQNATQQQRTAAHQQQQMFSPVGMKFPGAQVGVQGSGMRALSKNGSKERSGQILNRPQSALQKRQQEQQVEHTNQGGLRHLLQQNFNQNRQTKQIMH